MKNLLSNKLENRNNKIFEIINTSEDRSKIFEYLFTKFFGIVMGKP